MNRINKIFLLKTGKLKFRIKNEYEISKKDFKFFRYFYQYIFIKFVINIFENICPWRKIFIFFYYFPKFEFIMKLTTLLIKKLSLTLIALRSCFLKAFKYSLWRLTMRIPVSYFWLLFSHLIDGKVLFCHDWLSRLNFILW